MTNYKQKLDMVLFEDEGLSDKQSPIDVLLTLHDDYLESLENVNNIKKKFEYKLEEIIHQLAANIRKLQPKLSTSLSKNGCKIEYKSKWLHVSLNPKSKMWDIDGSNKIFGNGFIKENESLSSDICELAGMIVKYFQQHYKSLS